MTNLRVSLVQTDLVWEDPAANCAQLEERLADLAGKTDVVVLPEMFATGFSMSPTGAEIGRGPVLQWMQVQASRLGALMIGSLKVKQQNSFLNRLYAVHPDGSFVSYDKRHLFRMGAENEFYQAGDKQVIVSYKGWNLAVFICYDLRFPVWSRNVGMAYDAAIYVANWPAPRANAWRTLLQARAIENLAYVVGVNRVGTDANNLSYAGDSLLVDFKGGLQLDLQAKDQILTSELSAVDLADFRAKFPAHLDADLFSLSSL
ncbi:amidohydrolase [Aquirufa antheringensis]|jgi:omega-amidase|uniref:Omega-amidase YafV n=1 Tax=Aquirufa antheringensis TaxID=2516559 RepID=A0A4Q9BEZ5_9BACT|nr:amidohydrolase [Aquirufa antheringensis]MCZ2484192.1 amidohydrolase [Aquirufa antheringensis]MCZ2487941.1 amidohydrolase [Aquirufa antheringensis]MCZ2489219.1 amidohydrolase [Aquirufa antheringensis]TBH74597.1 amidohydrolase [Aquirufa antheringensis]